MTRDFMGDAKRQRQLEDQAAIEKSQQVGDELRTAIAHRKEQFRSQVDVIEPLLAQMADNIKANGGEATSKDSAGMYNSALQFYARDLRFQIPGNTIKIKSGQAAWYLFRVSPGSAGVKIELLKQPPGQLQLTQVITPVTLPVNDKLEDGIASIFADELKRIL